MAIITLDEAKLQLGIDKRDNTEDTYITMLLDTATEMVFNYIRRTEEDVIAEYQKIPAPLKHAALIFVDNLFENRGSIAFAATYKMPHHLEALLSIYVNRINA